MARAARQRMVDWLERHVYRGRGGQQALREAVYDGVSQQIWAAGTATAEVRADRLSVATRESLGVHFLRMVIQESIDLWAQRFKWREAALRAHHRGDMTLKKWIQDLKRQGRREREDGDETPPDSDTEEEGVDEEWGDLP